MVDSSCHLKIEWLTGFDVGPSAAKWSLPPRSPSVAWSPLHSHSLAVFCKCFPMSWIIFTNRKEQVRHKIIVMLEMRYLQNTTQLNWHIFRCQRHLCWKKSGRLNLVQREIKLQGGLINWNPLKLLHKYRITCKLISPSVRSYKGIL